MSYHLRSLTRVLLIVFFVVAGITPSGWVSGRAQAEDSVSHDTEGKGWKEEAVDSIAVDSGEVKVFIINRYKQKDTGFTVSEQKKLETLDMKSLNIGDIIYLESGEFHVKSIVIHTVTRDSSRPVKFTVVKNKKGDSFCEVYSKEGMVKTDSFSLDTGAIYLFVPRCSVKNK